MIAEKAAAIALLAQLRRGYKVRLTVQGVSMQPLAREGDTVQIRKAEKYRKGDVVVFLYADRGLLIHRIIAMHEGYILTKGDHAVNAEKVEAAHIWGRAEAVFRQDIKVDMRHAVLNYVIACISYSHHRLWKKHGTHVDCFTNWRIRLIALLDIIMISLKK